MKKRFVALLTAFLVLFLAACGQSGKQDASSSPSASPTSGTSASSAPSGGQAGTGKKVTIQWGIYQDPARLEVSEKQAEAFNKKNPNIEVKVVATPFAQYYEKLGTQIATNSAYDVMMISGSYFENVVKQGGFMDLTDLIKRDGLDFSQYTTEKANSEWEGRIYALPYELDIQALFYNKDLFDAANVPYPTEDWTWEDLLDAAQKLTRVVDGKQTWGFYADNLYPSWVSFIGQNNGSVFAEDGRTPTLNTPEVIETLQFLRDLIYKYKVSPAPGDLPQGVNAFHSGLVAMVVDGSYSVRPTQNTVKFNWDVAPLPAGKRKAAAYWTQGIAVYAKTPHPEEAWEFAKFLMSQEAQEILAETKMATPSLKSVANSPLYLEGGPSGIKAFIDAYEYGEPVPFNEHWFDIMRGPNSAMGEPFSLLWLDKISAEEAAKRAQENVEKVLSK